MVHFSKIVKLFFNRNFNILVYVATVVVTLMWVFSVQHRYQYRTTHQKPSSSVKTPGTTLSATRLPEDPQMKYILEWVEPHFHPFWKEGQKEFQHRKCKIDNCIVTTNRRTLKSLNDFDAVVFHGSTIAHEHIEKPELRNPNQKYVFVSMKSNHYYPICDTKYDGFFNWTWTYKLESDVSGSHFIIKNRTGEVIGPDKNINWIDIESMDPIDEQLKEQFKVKTKAAAWIVSNCYSLSQRERFVRKLQMELRDYGLEIDIFGNCGDTDCDTDECVKSIGRTYYFYLALENSFGEDYVTDNLLLALQNYLVPVVFGGANYTRFMPDGIYLNGGKMNPKALAKEMYDIINDKERYYSFFKWRNHYSYHSREEAPDSDDHCKFCEMLHDEELMKKKTIYHEFRKWWNVPGKCKGF